MISYAFGGISDIIKGEDDILQQRLNINYCSIHLHKQYIMYIILQKIKQKMHHISLLF